MEASEPVADEGGRWPGRRPSRPDETRDVCGQGRNTWFPELYLVDVEAMSGSRRGDTW